MKKVMVWLLALCMVLSLAACGSSEGVSNAGGETTQAEESGFRVGFGRVKVTPQESVPMGGYENSSLRMSTGLFTELYVNVLAVDDGENTLLLMTIDHSWFHRNIADPVRRKITEQYGIPEEYVLMNGTHTHAAPDASNIAEPSQVQDNKRVQDLSMEAVQMAMEDLKPARIFVGSVMTENMNFVRRYFMDDGSFTGDNYPGTGTTLVSHESEADGQMQLMKFVREGGKDVLIANFQAHPHLEGKTNNLSAQTPGAFRDSVEQKLDVYSIYWQGAAGNLNSSSYISGETVYTKRNEYGEALADYAASVYDSMTEVASGPVKVLHYEAECEVNHEYDHLVGEARVVWEYYSETADAKGATEMGKTYGISSPFHANRIIGNASLETTKDIPLAVFSFGDVSGVVVPYEMFDTNGMQIKEQTPFEMTFIFGYANPGYYGYIPSAAAWENGGYEVDNCTYVGGTGDKLAQEYLKLLGELKG